MDPGDALFAVGSLALFFFVPGYLMVKALWPEKRWRGPDRSAVALEMVTGGFVASLGIFLLVGFALGNTGNFWASSSDPVLQEVLVAFALLFLGLGWFRGAFARDPPPVPRFVEPEGPGEEPVEPVVERFRRMMREEAKLEREIRQRRRAGAPAGEIEALQAELKSLRESRRKAEREREASYDG